MGIYHIAPLYRLLDFPFPVHTIGWMPQHSCHHKNSRLQEIFFCFSFNKASENVVEINGNITTGGTYSSFSMLPVDTKLNTIRATLHDELFFSYAPDTEENWCRIFKCNQFSFENVTPDTTLKQTISHIKDTLDRLHEPGAADTLDRLAFSFITGMYIDEKSKQSRNALQNDFRIEELAAKLRHGYPLEQLIRHYGFSRRNFFRIWKQFCPGQTPTQYRILYQLAKAEKLLTQSNMTIAEIATRAGFSSAVHFNRTFKLVNGCTPTEFRRQKAPMKIPGFPTHASPIPEKWSGHL